MAENEPQQPASDDRAERIREVVQQYLQALHRAVTTSGTAPDQSDWIARFADLAPDLEPQLQRAEAFFQATKQTFEEEEPDWLDVTTRLLAGNHDASPGEDRGSTDPANEPTLPSLPHDRLDRETALGLRCPHCGHHIRLVVGTDTEITCRNCGSSFHFDSAVSSPAESVKTPDFVGRFKVLERLGRGGFGVVYKAQDPLLTRTVAVKMPRAGYFVSTEDEERFLREARNAARLRHSNIVHIHEIDHDHGVPYIVSEFIEGTTFADVLAHQRISFVEAVEVIATVAEAVDYAHQQRLVHRDIKPSNILLDNDWHPYVTDFGLARQDDTEITITMDGQVLGTPAYMSPEQAAGEQRKIDRRSDVYSLGVVLYHALSGELPFRGSRRMLVQQVIQDEPRPPRRVNEHIPRDLETITLKAIAKDPHRRYATARDFADDLRRWQRGEAIHARRVGRFERCSRWCRRNPLVAGLTATIALLLIIAALVAGAWGWRESVLRESADAQRVRAETSEQSSRHRLVQLHLQNGVRQMETGDLFSALLWFAGAMQADAQDAPLTDSHRLRIGMLLDRCPALLQLWPLPGRVTCAEMHPQGDRMVVATDNGSLAVYPVDSGEPVVAGMRHDMAITLARFSPTGDRIVSLGQDNAALLWNAVTGERIARLEHMDTPLHAAFSPDGRLLATVARDGQAHVWNASTGELLSTLDHGDRIVTRAVFSPDSTRLLTSSKSPQPYRGEMRLWQVETGQQIGPLMPHGQYVWHAEFNADGSQIVSAGDDRTVRLWNGQTGDPIGSPLFHDGPVYRAFFVDSGQRLVAATTAGKVYVWDIASATLENRMQMHHGATLTTAVMDRSRTLLATGGVDGRARVWNWARSELVAPPLPHNSLVTSIAFDVQERRVLTASQDGTVKLWDLAPAQPDAKLFPHDGPVTRARFSPDGTCVLTTSYDHTARLWNTSSATPVGPPLRHDGEILDGDFSPDGKLIATASSDATAQIWDRETGTAVGPRLSHAAAVTLARFSPDGRILVTCSNDGSAKAWDTRTQQLRFVVNHQDRILWADFSPDGRWLATASLDSTARIWHCDDGSPAVNALQHEDAVLYCRFSPDGQQLVTGSRDTTAILWDAVSGRPLGPPLRHTASVATARFNSTGQQLMTGDYHGNAKLWDISDLTQPIGAFSRADTAIGGLALAPIDTLLATTNNRHEPSDPARPGDGATYFWDLTSGTLLAPPLCHRAAIQGVQFHPQGRAVLTASEDHTAKVWNLIAIDLPVDDVVSLAQLLSGRRIDQRFNDVAIDAVRLRELFTAARTRHPRFFATTPAEIAAWQQLTVRTSDPEHVSSRRSDSPGARALATQGRPS